MDNWQDSFIDLLPMLMFTWSCNIIRSILALDVEKRLGRRMTDGEWLYYLLDSYLKGEVERYQQAVKEWCQQLADLKVIHDFVWNG